ncbi:MAG TPA: hypothetical protein VKV80_05320 [Streptosporangiaceae bacterium]|nr:hypothetical protein [Streptosporangiaceae bacterium]
MSQPSTEAISWRDQCPWVPPHFTVALILGDRTPTSTDALLGKIRRNKGFWCDLICAWLEYSGKNADVYGKTLVQAVRYFQGLPSPTRSSVSHLMIWAQCVLELDERLGNGEFYDAIRALKDSYRAERERLETAARAAGGTETRVYEKLSSAADGDPAQIAALAIGFRYQVNHEFKKLASGLLNDYRAIEGWKGSAEQSKALDLISYALTTTLHEAEGPLQQIAIKVLSTAGGSKISERDAGQLDECLDAYCTCYAEAVGDIAKSLAQFQSWARTYTRTVMKQSFRSEFPAVDSLLTHGDTLVDFIGLGTGMLVHYCPPLLAVGPALSLMKAGLDWLVREGLTRYESGKAGEIRSHVGMTYGGRGSRKESLVGDVMKAAEELSIPMTPDLAGRSIDLISEVTLMAGQEGFSHVAEMLGGGTGLGVISTGIGYSIRYQKMLEKAPELQQAAGKDELGRLASMVDKAFGETGPDGAGDLDLGDIECLGGTAQEGYLMRLGGVFGTLKDNVFSRADDQGSADRILANARENSPVLTISGRQYVPDWEEAELAGAATSRGSYPFHVIVMDQDSSVCYPAKLALLPTGELDRRMGSAVGAEPNPGKIYGEVVAQARQRAAGFLGFRAVQGESPPVFPLRWDGCGYVCGGRPLGYLVLDVPVDQSHANQSFPGGGGMARLCVKLDGSVDAGASTWGNAKNFSVLPPGDLIAEAKPQPAGASAAASAGAVLAAPAGQGTTPQGLSVATSRGHTVLVNQPGYAGKVALTELATEAWDTFLGLLDTAFPTGRMTFYASLDPQAKTWWAASASPRIDVYAGYGTAELYDGTTGDRLVPAAPQPAAPQPAAAQAAALVEEQGVKTACGHTAWVNWPGSTGPIDSDVLRSPAWHKFLGLLDAAFPQRNIGFFVSLAPRSKQWWAVTADQAVQVYASLGGDELYDFRSGQRLWPAPSAPAGSAGTKAAAGEDEQDQALQQAIQASLQPPSPPSFPESTRGYQFDFSRIDRSDWNQLRLGDQVRVGPAADAICDKEGLASGSTVEFFYADGYLRLRALSDAVSFTAAMEGGEFVTGD